MASLCLPEARVDDDGAHLLPGGFEQGDAAVGEVDHLGDGGDVVGVLAQVEELAQAEAGGEPDAAVAFA